MYFWRIEKLKQEMARRAFSDREVLPYLVTFCALSTAVAYIPGKLENGWDIAGAIWSVLIVILGTIHIYRQNGGCEGQHFLQRYFVVGWVVSIRWLVIVIFCLMAFYLPLAFFRPTDEGSEWYDFLITAVLETLFYWRIGCHVRDLAMRTQAALPPLLDQNE